MFMTNWVLHRISTSKSVQFEYFRHSLLELYYFSRKGKTYHKLSFFTFIVTSWFKAVIIFILSQTPLLLLTFIFCLRDSVIILRPSLLFLSALTHPTQPHPTYSRPKFNPSDPEPPPHGRSLGAHNYLASVCTFAWSGDCVCLFSHPYVWVGPVCFRLGSSVSTGVYANERACICWR